MDWMPQAVREGIFTILFISGPLVVLAAGLGLTIGIIQAATQVQEQTLGSAVKVIGLFLALIIFGYTMFQYLRQYTLKSVEKAFRLVPSMGKYIKPRRNFLTVPIEGEEDVMPLPPKGKPPSQTEDLDPSKVKSRYSGGILDEPDIVNINSGATPERLAAPSKQTRKQDTNIKTQPLVKNSVVKPVKQEPIKEQDLVGVSAKPEAKEEALPETRPKTNTKRRPRRSLSDSILKLKQEVEAK